VRHVLIIEDLKDAQRWLREAVLLAFPDAEVSCCNTLDNSLHWIAKHAPDLCLVDLKLPDGTGVDFIRSCHSRHPSAYQVVTTIYDDDIHLFPAIHAGASGYLLKDEPKASIAQALKTGVNEGSPPLSAQVARRMIRYFKHNGVGNEPEKVPSSSAVHLLSPREQETLTRIAAGHTIAQTAQILGVSYHTAARHVKNLYAKLGISARAEAVREAIRLGLYDPNS